MVEVIFIDYIVFNGCIIAMQDVKLKWFQVPVELKHGPAYWKFEAQKVRMMGAHLGMLTFFVI